MEDLRRQNYIQKLKQDPWGSTYWTITTSGLNYLQALESFANPKVEPVPQPEPQPEIVHEPPAQITSAPVLTTAVSSVPPRKRYFWPFVERVTLRVRGLVSWEEMPTHLASHLIYDGAKALVFGSVFGGVMLYMIHLLHQILKSLPHTPK